MDINDVSMPESYNDRESFLLYKQTRVDNSRRKLKRLEDSGEIYDDLFGARDYRREKHELTILLAELHIAETKAE